MTRRTLVRMLALATVLPVVVSISWIVTEMAIAGTSDAAFCSGCHSMVPMARANARDLHGGNSSHGVVATCVDCHLPHDNAVNYLYQKGVTGLRDIWAEMTHDLAAIDWEKMRERRAEFVYDSGCLHCHVRLEEATRANPKAFVAHRPYFLGETERACVDCHQSVGHQDLMGEIARIKEEGQWP